MYGISRDWYDEARATMGTFASSTVRWIKSGPDSGWRDEHGQHIKQTKNDEKFRVSVNSENVWAAHKVCRMNLNCEEKFDDLNLAEGFMDSLKVPPPSNPPIQDVISIVVDFLRKFVNTLN